MVYPRATLRVRDPDPCGMSSVRSLLAERKWKKAPLYGALCSCRLQLQGNGKHGMWIQPGCELPFDGSVYSMVASSTLSTAQDSTLVTVGLEVYSLRRLRSQHLHERQGRPLNGIELSRRVDPHSRVSIVLHNPQPRISVIIQVDIVGPLCVL